MDSKHDGCFACGDDKQAVLVSQTKTVRLTRGRDSGKIRVQSVALCDKCKDLPEIIER